MFKYSIDFVVIVVVVIVVIVEKDLEILNKFNAL